MTTLKSSSVYHVGFSIKGEDEVDGVVDGEVDGEVNGKVDGEVYGEDGGYGWEDGHESSGAENCIGGDGVDMV